MDIFLQSQTWIALLTLTFLEIVLGIDNIIFISIISSKLPPHLQAKARHAGLLLALVMRIALLGMINWVVQFTQPLFTIFDHEVSGRDIILAAGGLFLIAKSTIEINHKMEAKPEGVENKFEHVTSFGRVLFQIILFDIIFSFDSILTAIGLSDQLLVMVLAIIISIIVMIVFVNRISAFINKHPSLVVLSLGFLILIGFMLFLEGLHREVPKGYIYFAVAFSLLVEIVNIRIRKSNDPVKLRKRV